MNGASQGCLIVALLLSTILYSCVHEKEIQVKRCEWILISKPTTEMYGKQGWLYEWKTCDGIYKHEFTQSDYAVLGQYIINRDNR